MPVDVRGSVACVTGGGRGIGRATAKRLAALGARVVIGDLDADHARSAAREIGGQAVGVALDVADLASFREFIARAERLGPVGVLVNNAGVMRTGPFAEQTIESQLREIAINLGGVVTGMGLVLPKMQARGHGHIANVASMAGKMSVPGAAVYTASKFGVVSLSRAVRAELTSAGVSITTILPAAVRTELTSGLDIRGVPTSSPDDVARAIAASCRHGRAEITIPRGLGLIGAVEQSLPERVGEWVKRTVGAQRRVVTRNERARAYQERASL